MADGLFSKEDLEAFLQRRHDDFATDGIPDDVSTGIPDKTYSVVQRMVSAWLLDATKLEKLPTDHDLVWSWAVELAALAVENPGATTSMTTLGTTKQWSKADLERRASILARARTWAREWLELPADAGAPSPLGSFPHPAPLPAELLRPVRWRR